MERRPRQVDRGPKTLERPVTAYLESYVATESRRLGPDAGWPVGPRRATGDNQGDKKVNKQRTVTASLRQDRIICGPMLSRVT